MIGRLLANDARMGKVTYTIQDPQDGSIQFCTVEQLAIHHYQTEHDYTFGKFLFGKKKRFNETKSDFRHSFGRCKHENNGWNLIFGSDLFLTDEESLN